MHLKESMKNRENLEETMKIPWERGTQLGFDEHQGQGEESPRNQRDSVENT
jgi:hypothetical protein